MYIKRLLLVISGLLSLGLAVIGIFLPLIPTTPLLLLSAACFIRSSDRLYQWLITNKYLGPYIKNYREGKGIPLSAKIVGVSLLWISMLFTIFFVVPLVAVKLLLAGIAGYFTWFILKQKTLIKVHH
ncbi:YbaN family protein [Paucisalibacillus globulus]|uniref:YbaN family protein n=1 Tax=Paucisalibacillus globulus TaxID=351095 RepID=UPI000BB9B403|nr:YbaN family protein [Paucisalibacillus globulus]